MGEVQFPTFIIFYPMATSVWTFAHQHRDSYIKNDIDLFVGQHTGKELQPKIHLLVKSLWEVQAGNENKQKKKRAVFQYSPMPRLKHLLSCELRQLSKFQIYTILENYILHFCRKKRTLTEMMCFVQVTQLATDLLYIICRHSVLFRK